MTQDGGSLTKYVLDSSVAASWFFEDEYTPETDKLMVLARDHGVVVPALSPFEIGNLFLQAEKKGRQTMDQINQKLAAFAEFPLEIDTECTFERLPLIIKLARTHHLTVYDASYLELALRRGIALATRDKALRQAAEKLGITVLPE